MHAGAQIIIDKASVNASGLSRGWDRFAHEARCVLAGEGAVRARRARLVEEHRDLDDLIAVLADSPVSDDALISRLKKRKLSVRDEIVRADAQLFSGVERAPP